MHPWQPRGLQRWHHTPKQKHRRSDVKGHHESILAEHTKLFTTFFFHVYSFLLEWLTTNNYNTSNAIGSWLYTFMVMVPIL